MHAVEGVVHQISGNHNEVRGFGPNAFNGCFDQARHFAAETTRDGRGAGQVASQVEIGNMSNFHGVSFASYGIEG